MTEEQAADLINGIWQIRFMLSAIIVSILVWVWAR